MRRIKWNIPDIKGPLKSNEAKKYIDMYTLCPCGSGNKYKFCCYGVEDKLFHNPNELYMHIRSRRDNKLFCMYSNGDFHKDIIKAHSIQNNKILSKLASDGHVYVADFNQNKFGGVDLKKRGKNEATTATCFCKYHDTELFKYIGESTSAKKNKIFFMLTGLFQNIISVFKCFGENDENFTILPQEAYEVCINGLKMEIKSD